MDESKRINTFVVSYFYDGMPSHKAIEAQTKAGAVCQWMEFVEARRDKHKFVFDHCSTLKQWRAGK